MVDSIYHRRGSANSDEQSKVAASGKLWGKSPRIVAGNGPPCVKAYIGPLPEHETGYSFKTSISPSATRRFWGELGVVWTEGAHGVNPVNGHNEYVCIAVEIIDG